MKRTIKIILITLASIIVLVIAAVGTSLWFVTTPGKITPVLNKQVSKFISCPTSFKNVKLSIVHTFPYLGLNIDSICMINPINGAPSDTILFAEKCRLSVNAKAFLDDKQIIVNEINLKNAFVNIFNDENGISNIAVFNSNSSSDDTTSSFDLSQLTASLKVLKIQEVTVLYNDLKSNLSLEARHANIDIDGKLKDASFEGKLLFNIPDASFQLDSVDYLIDETLDLNLPLSIQLADYKSLSLNKAIVTIAEKQIALDGTMMQLASNETEVNVAVDIENWDIPEVLAMIPEAFSSFKKNLSLESGIASVNAKIAGIYSENSFPVIDADVKIESANGKYSSIPYAMKDVNLEASGKLYLKDTVPSNLFISKLTAKARNSSLDVSGTVYDFLEDFLIDANVKANIYLPDVYPVLPKSLNIEAEGRATADLKGKFTLKQLQDFDLNKISLKGEIKSNTVTGNYNDSMFFTAEQLNVDLTLPYKANPKVNDIMMIKLNSSKIDFSMTDGPIFAAKDAKIEAAVSDFTSDDPIAAAGNVKFSDLTLTIDTVSGTIKAPNVAFVVAPNIENASIVDLSCQYNSRKVTANMGDSINFDINSLSLDLNSHYDEKQENFMLKWDPYVKVNIITAGFKISQLEYSVIIPSFNVSMTPDTLLLSNSKIMMGRNDFNLAGTITGMKNYIEKTGDLHGDLMLTGHFIDIDQIMDIVSGFGSTDTTKVVAVSDDEPDPFMVPLNMDVRLNTHIKKAVTGETVLENLGGHVSIKDGALILEEMGFTSDAAKMQLTALYKSPRKDHLFVGLDFHLLDIDIARLIKMIPDIDTIVPMLKSFSGKAECHIAAETNLKSDYSLKFSTLRGAAAIEGQNLVLLDSETFTQISKYLVFNKKAENMVDSLSVEMTVFRDEVDLYPFLIVMGKYKAVVSGRHNLDQSFDYHISLTDCPLPVRLGLNVSGPSFKDISYKLAPCKYAYLYRPEKRSDVQTKTIELKKMISDALKANVKPQ